MLAQNWSDCPRHARELACNAVICACQSALFPPAESGCEQGDHFDAPVALTNFSEQLAWASFTRYFRLISALRHPQTPARPPTSRITSRLCSPAIRPRCGPTDPPRPRSCDQHAALDVFSSPTAHLGGLSWGDRVKCFLVFRLQNHLCPGLYSNPPSPPHPTLLHLC